MSKKITVELDDEVINKIKNDHFISEDLINDALDLYLDNNYDYQSASILKKNLENLQEQIGKLQNEKQSLEIEKTCLKQENTSLHSRINDLSDLYPSASILLGNKPSFKQDTISKLKGKLLKRK
jgi:regulator of replication initiation timing